MTPRWTLTWVCYWRGHASPIWKFTARGIGFECPDCHRFRVSPALNEVA